MRIRFNLPHIHTPATEALKQGAPCHSLRRLGLYLFCLMLSACVSIPVGEPHDVSPLALYNQRARQLKAITGWHLVGKIALSNGIKSTSATINWRQSPNALFMIITGAFGHGRTDISFTQGKAIARTKDQVYKADSLDQLFIDHLGWNMPMSNIKRWLLGIATTAPPASSDINSEGQLTQTHHDEWLVKLSKYKDIDSIALPTKLILSQHDVTVKLVVSQWIETRTN